MGAVRTEPSPCTCSEIQPEDTGVCASELPHTSCHLTLGSCRECPVTPLCACPVPRQVRWPVAGGLPSWSPCRGRGEGQQVWLAPPPSGNCTFQEISWNLSPKHPECDVSPRLIVAKPPPQLSREEGRDFQSGSVFSSLIIRKCVLRVIV